MGLTSFPRLRLAALPTPVEFLERLTGRLGGPRIYIKRDDLTGLAFGGNKTRKLEYLVADAQRRGATHLVTCGAIQSNHARQTAAAARIAGMQAELVLNAPDPEPELQGNYLLDTLLGARCHIIPAGEDAEAKIEKVATGLRDEGHTPYSFPTGGSNPVGALGYVSAMLELNAQLWDLGIAATHLYYPTGSGGTQAGVVLGAAMYGADYTVTGVAVSGTAEQKIERAWALIPNTAELLGIVNPVRREGMIVDGSQIGEGYGIPTPEALEAIQLLARTEGILLDPVYTAKAFAGLIADVRAGKLTAEDTVVFLHTGGTPALFAMREELASIL